MKSRTALGAVLLVVVLGLLVLGFVRGWFPGSQPGGDSPVTGATRASVATPQPSPASTTTDRAPSTTKAPGKQQTPQRPSSIDPESGLAWVDPASLPAEARDTLRLIDKGGPYPYDRDGVVFGNFEGLLPKKPSGYYHEYTVKTPGSKDRGARRIITGRNGEFYWTADHYASFARIRR